MNVIPIMFENVALALRGIKCGASDGISDGIRDGIRDGFRRKHPFRIA